MNDSPYFPWPGSYPAKMGISQYAEIAARFHAALLGGELSYTNRINPVETAQRAFDHADAFFAELMARESEESQRRAVAHKAANPHLFPSNVWRK